MTTHSEVEMRRYDDPVEVRKGMVTGSAGAGVEGPEQFLWRGKLWKVCEVVAHWVETGPWWQSSGVRAVLGAEDEPGAATRGRDLVGAGRAASGLAASGLAASGLAASGRAASGSVASGSAASGPAASGSAVSGPAGCDLVAEREVWRVEAARGAAGLGSGVFDLVFDWADGSWRLARCVD